MYVVNICVHPKYVVVVCKLQFIGEKLFVCPPPTASGHTTNDSPINFRIDGLRCVVVHSYA